MESTQHGEEGLQQWLTEVLQAHGAVAGTLHKRVGDALELQAAVNIPPHVQALTRTIPKGKGMAGLAWERDAPVQTCNLQSDTSGDVRPGARAVGAQASVAIPIRDAQGAVCGVVGFAFAKEGEFDPETLARFDAAAATVPWAHDAH